MVVQDGLSRATGWKLPSVLDSLISLKEIPVMIGIFIDHGKVEAARPSADTAGKDNYPRFNRSFEYDALGDRYARFLVEEILPEIGRTYNISKDPNDRSIAGASSGAIAAFNVAWERPNEFRRVLSTIGTYVGLRGGDEFATLVRKVEPKPLRVFLADGNHDLNIYAGDWWMANQDMLTALTWAGYEVNHLWGEGGHDSQHAVKIMPEALKWLWKDYPASIQTHQSPARRLYPVIDGEGWNEIKVTEAVNKLAVNGSGEIFYTAKKSVYKIDANGSAVVFANLKGQGGGLSFREDGKLIVADVGQHKILSITPKGVQQDLVMNATADFLATSSKGIYFTETGKDRVGFYSYAGKDVHYVNVADHPTGLAINAEQTFLNVSVANGVFGYSLKIAENGDLESGQEYIHYHIPYGNATPGSGGMAVDSENLLYTATKMGIQISDQLGRVNFIISSPAGSMSDVTLGGPGFSTLYVNSDGRLFSRKTTSKGILSWQPPVKPPKPGL